VGGWCFSYLFFLCVKQIETTRCAQIKKATLRDVMQGHPLHRTHFGHCRECAWQARLHADKLSASLLVSDSVCGHTPLAVTNGLTYSVYKPWCFMHSIGSPIWALSAATSVALRLSKHLAFHFVLGNIHTIPFLWNRPTKSCDQPLSHTEHVPNKCL